jgi:hypothetical protein
MPADKPADAAFKLAKVILRFLAKENNSTQSNSYSLKINDDPFKGNWEINDISDSWHTDIQGRSVVCWHTHKPTAVINSIKVWALNIPSLFSRIFSTPPFPSLPADFFKSNIALFQVPLKEDQLLTYEPFRDPFTTLAARALQECESRFVSEAFSTKTEENGDYRFSFQNDTLSLEKRDTKPSDGAAAAMKTYMKFINAMYGDYVLNILNYDFGLNLGEQNELTPDFVFKANEPIP